MLNNPKQRDHLLYHPRVHPVARQLFLATLNEVRLVYPAVVVEVYRSPTRQRMLYAQGRSDAQLRRIGFTQEEIEQARQRGYTQNKPRVTYVLQGRHTQGKAMDIAFLVDGKLTWNVPLTWWRTYGAIAKKHGLVWGGDWKMRDYPHVEYRGD